MEFSLNVTAGSPWRRGRSRSEYLPAVRPFLQKYGAEMRVAGSNAEPAEGEPPNGTAVIRFADTGAAWGFPNDPGYQPVLLRRSV